MEQPLQINKPRKILRPAKGRYTSGQPAESNINPISYTPRIVISGTPYCGSQELAALIAEDYGLTLLRSTELFILKSNSHQSLSEMVINSWKTQEHSKIISEIDKDINYLLNMGGAVIDGEHAILDAEEYEEEHPYSRVFKIFIDSTEPTRAIRMKKCENLQSIDAARIQQKILDETTLNGWKKLKGINYIEQSRHEADLILNTLKYSSISEMYYGLANTKKFSKYMTSAILPTQT